ncbi:hypothetical protein [Nocardioides stalactiti]|uniref:hypothetical protein n=1 Tax=Nocardioides stalactiti TaxID=2755356 RepID=UPI0016024D40|nr:hypothetical protein [Nocardioides stalactiti]
MDAYRAASAVGGDVRTYCGIVLSIPASDPADIDEAHDASPEDCATCADVWLGRTWIRL